MSDLKRPLDPAAVKAADDAFYAAHPEFVGPDGKRIPLSATDPAQAALRREWRNAYVAAGGPVEGGESNKPPGGGTEPCPPCNHPGGGGDKPPGGGTGPGPGPDKPNDKPGKPTPTLTVRWSKPEVTPDHNSSYPPATAPTDVVPAEAKVQLIGETTNVPDGTSATMTIYHCATGAQVPEAAFSGLEVRGGKVVVASTGQPPEWFFDARHDLWAPWNKPWYFFQCDVAFEGLSKQTPRDFAKQAGDCLRLKYWHPCVCESSTLSGVLPEVNTVSGILAKVPHSAAHVENITSPDLSRANYGSLIRNSYAFHQASHGNALKRSDNSGMPDDDPGDSKYTKSEWRSIVHMTPSPRFGDLQIGATGSFPSMPRYLYYASTCLTGWEPSFANAMLARGTRNVLAFRCTIPDAEAPALAKKFYTRWAAAQLDPSKIPDCFFKTAPDHHKNMKPILYGAGGGHTKGFVENAVDTVVDAIKDAGAAIGDAISGWFK